MKVCCVSYSPERKITISIKFVHLSKSNKGLTRSHQKANKNQQNYHLDIDVEQKSVSSATRIISF